MTNLTRVLVWLARWLGDWLLLAARVRKILDNDLPHLRRDQRKTHDLVVEQIGFCRGVRESAEQGSSPCAAPDP